MQAEKPCAQHTDFGLTGSVHYSLQSYLSGSVLCVKPFVCLFPGGRERSLRVRAAPETETRVPSHAQLSSDEVATEPHRRMPCRHM
jgi:hypothetical protein